MRPKSLLRITLLFLFLSLAIQGTGAAAEPFHDRVDSEPAYTYLDLWTTERNGLPAIAYFYAGLIVIGLTIAAVILTGGILAKLWWLVAGFIAVGILLIGWAIWPYLVAILWSITTVIGFTALFIYMGYILGMVFYQSMSDSDLF